MGKFKLYFRVMKDFLTKNIVEMNDIADAYSMISNKYDDLFIDVMGKHNVYMLSQLCVADESRILDLACGTGFNSKWLLEHYPNVMVDCVDISEGMLAEARSKLHGKVQLFQTSMLDYLRQCEENTYDIVVCSWALKYQSPINVLRECNRVMKKNGQIGIIVNSKSTLPEMRKIYPHILIDNTKNIKKLMMKLPNPKNEKHLGKWFSLAGFTKINVVKGEQKFNFASCKEAVEWVTSTGALAGFDIMVDLHDDEIKNQMIELFEKFGLTSVTHNFVIGGAVKC